MMAPKGSRGCHNIEHAMGRLTASSLPVIQKEVACLNNPNAVDVSLV